MISRFFGLLFFLTSINLFAQVSTPIIEEYNFQFGSSGGSELLFHDPAVGNGNAQVRFHVIPISNQESQVQIEIFRHIIGKISFALLLDRIEIDFANSAGATIKTIVLDQSLGQDGLFVIGDSADGYFENTRKLTGMGAVRSVRLRLFGNYE